MKICRNLFHLITPLACFVLAAAQADLAPGRILSLNLYPQSVTTLQCDPGFVTSVRLPEAVSSVVLGDPGALKAEDSEGSARDATPNRSQPLSTLAAQLLLVPHFDFHREGLGQLTLDQHIKVRIPGAANLESSTYLRKRFAHKHSQQVLKRRRLAHMVSKRTAHLLHTFVGRSVLAMDGFGLNYTPGFPLIHNC